MVLGCCEVYSNGIYLDEYVRKIDTFMSAVGAVIIMALLFGIGVFFLKRDKN